MRLEIDFVFPLAAALFLSQEQSDQLHFRMMLYNTKGDLRNKINFVQQLFSKL